MAEDRIDIKLTVEAFGSLEGRDVRSLEPAIEAAINGAAAGFRTYALTLPDTTPCTFDWEVKSRSNRKVGRAKGQGAK